MSDKLKEEIATLKQSLLARDEEIKRLNRRRPLKWITVLSIVAILCSLIYYIKVNDQTVNEVRAKTSHDLRVKDNRIDGLTQELDENSKKLKSVSNELNNKKSIIDRLNTDLTTIRSQLDKSEETNGNKDKQIKDLLNEIQLRDAENAKLVSRSSHYLMLKDAWDGSHKLLYGTNETTAQTIISVAKESLTDESLIPTCAPSEAKEEEYNVYRNCFRDLSIVVHNKLLEEFGPHWAVTTGSVDNCFSINVIDESNREEYFFTIEAIYFEIFRFTRDVTVAGLPTTTTTTTTTTSTAKPQSSTNTSAPPK